MPCHHMKAQATTPKKTGEIVADAVVQLPALQNALLFQQANRPVDGRHRNAAVERHGAAVELLDVRVIFAFGEDARDESALTCHLQAALDAHLFDPGHAVADGAGLSAIFTRDGRVT